MVRFEMAQRCQAQGGQDKAQAKAADDRHGHQFGVGGAAPENGEKQEREAEKRQSGSGDPLWRMPVGQMAGEGDGDGKGDAGRKQRQTGSGGGKPECILQEDGN